MVGFSPETCFVPFCFSPLLSVVNKPPQKLAFVRPKIQNDLFKLKRSCDPTKINLMAMINTHTHTHTQQQQQQPTCMLSFAQHINSLQLSMAHIPLHNSCFLLPQLNLCGEDASACTHPPLQHTQQPTMHMSHQLLSPPLTAAAQLLQLLQLLPWGGGCLLLAPFHPGTPAAGSWQQRAPQHLQIPPCASLLPSCAGWGLCIWGAPFLLLTIHLCLPFSFFCTTLLQCCPSAVPHSTTKHFVAAP